MYPKIAITGLAHKDNVDCCYQAAAVLVWHHAAVAITSYAIYSSAISRQLLLIMQLQFVITELKIYCITSNSPVSIIRG